MSVSLMEQTSEKSPQGSQNLTKHLLKANKSELLNVSNFNIKFLNYRMTNK